MVRVLDATKNGLQETTRLPRTPAPSTRKWQQQKTNNNKKNAHDFRIELRFKQVNGRDFGKSSLIGICIGLVNIVPSKANKRANHQLVYTRTHIDILNAEAWSKNYKT